MKVILRFIVLFFSLVVRPFFAMAIAGVVSGGPEKFECGRYILAGKYWVNKDGISTIFLYPGTTREFTVLLKQDSGTDKIQMHNEYVKIEVKINKPSVGSETTASFIKNLDIISAREARENPIMMLNTTICE